MHKIGAAVIGFFAAWFASYIVASHTVKANRRAESNINEKSAILLIRDDIGGMHNLIVITNGLLAAILAAMIF